jgi:hypothetical protein
MLPLSKRQRRNAYDERHHQKTTETLHEIPSCRYVRAEHKPGRVCPGTPRSPIVLKIEHQKYIIASFFQVCTLSFQNATTIAAYWTDGKSWSSATATLPMSAYWTSVTYGSGTSLVTVSA